MITSDQQESRDEREAIMLAERMSTNDVFAVFAAYPDEYGD